MKKTLILSLTILMLTTSLSMAGVCPDNGNYSRTDVDIEDLIPQAKGFSLDRQYNSLNPRSGSLGRGWATDADKQIIIGGDGALLLFTPDRHKPMRYYPTSYGRDDLERVVERLLDADLAGEANRVPVQREALRNRLLASPAAIDDFYQNLLEQGRIEPLQVSVDKQFVYHCTSGGSLYRTKDGFQLEKPTAIEFYDRSGRLIAINGTNGEGLALRRDSNGQVKEVLSANGSRTAFDYDKEGKLLTITSDSKVKVTFLYGKDGLLASAKNATGSSLEYLYNPAGLLQTVLVSGRFVEEVEYNSDHTVLNFSKTDIEKKQYTYQQLSDDADQQRRQTSIKVESLFYGDEQPAEQRSYTYVYQKEPFGEQWISNRLYESDYSREETEYLSECKPLRVNTNGDIKQFDYDSGCRLEIKETDTETITLAYDDSWDKISRVTRTSKASGTTSWTTFEYTALGNLGRAEDSRGRSVVLTYDSYGRIASMTDEAEQTLEFEYNQLGKPNRISMRGEGTIDVLYDESGEIEEVKSDGGHKMALAVTRAFQKLLSIVKPAGVNFN